MLRFHSKTFVIFRLFPNPERNRFNEFPNGKRPILEFQNPWGGGGLYRRTVMISWMSKALKWLKSKISLLAGRRPPETFLLFLGLSRKK